LKNPAANGTTGTVLFRKEAGMKKAVFPAVLFCLICFGTQIAAAEEITLQTCEGYLKAMKIETKKAGPDRLGFKTGFPDGKTYEFLLTADKKNKFVYLAVVDLIKLPQNAPNLCQVTKQMAALNYGMVLAKLEWDSQKGEVRLSATMSTEDGLSQKRFAATLTTLLLSAEQVEKKLK
jgi:hypothetical protein